MREMRALLTGFTKDRKPVMKVCSKRLCTDIHALLHCSGTTKLLASIFHALWSCNGVSFIDLLSEFAVNMHISTSNIDMNNVTLSVLSIFTGADCLLAAIILAYILHDPRTKKDRAFKACQDSHRKLTLL